MPTRIYLDYASLTPIDPRAMKEMATYFGGEYANPSSLYKEGVAAKKALAAGRASVGAFIHGHADEVFFTSGGTEANGLALEGAGRTAHRNGIAKPHVIISAIEHSSVIECVAMMERQGVSVTRLPVDSSGRVSAEDVKKAITPNTYLVSIMTVNNELGTLQPIREIAKAIRWARTNVTKSAYPLFHTDAAQAALFTDLNVEQLGVDLLTLDSSKAYGPRGVGALFIKRGTPIEPIMYGGGQERGLRSGTENIPDIMGFAKALEIAINERDEEKKRIVQLRERFIEGLKKIRPDIEVHGESTHILNVSIPGIDNELFVLRLDAAGIACSTKSSCLRDADESYVLKAIGADSRTALRFSFGRYTKTSDIKKTLKAIAHILEKEKASL